MQTTGTAGGYDYGEEEKPQKRTKKALTTNEKGAILQQVQRRNRGKKVVSGMHERETFHRCKKTFKKRLTTEMESDIL